MKYWHSESAMGSSLAKRVLNLTRATFKQPTERWKKAVGHEHILQLQCYGAPGGRSGKSGEGREGEPSILSLAMGSAEDYARWVDALSLYSSGEATSAATKASHVAGAASGGCELG